MYFQNVKSQITRQESKDGVFNSGLNMSTSFVKRQPSSPSGGGGGGGGGGLPSVRGARPSPHGLHLIASSGVTTLVNYLRFS